MFELVVKRTFFLFFLFFSFVGFVTGAAGGGAAADKNSSSSEERSEIMTGSDSLIFHSSWTVLRTECVFFLRGGGLCDRFHSGGSVMSRGNLLEALAFVIGQMRLLNVTDKLRNNTRSDHKKLVHLLKDCLSGPPSTSRPSST